MSKQPLLRGWFLNQKYPFLFAGVLLMASGTVVSDSSALANKSVDAIAICKSAGAKSEGNPQSPKCRASNTRNLGNRPPRQSLSDSLELDYENLRAS